MAAFDSAATIINDAATELGLSPVADPFGSTDQNFILLCQFLKTEGTKLLRRRRWSQLQRTYTFQTVAGKANYPFPPDYESFIDQTAWNRTNRLPIGGPISPQLWQYLKARLVGVVFTVLDRQLAGNFLVYPDGAQTPGSYVIAYEYVSNFWVVPAALGYVPGNYNSGNAGSGADKNGTMSGNFLPWTNGETLSAHATRLNGGNAYSTNGGGTTGEYGPVGTGTLISDGGIGDWQWVSATGQSVPKAKDDVICLDSNMVSRALKLAWLRQKNMPSQAAKDDFDEAFLAACNSESPAPLLDISKNPADFTLIGENNLPVTGYGH